MSASADGGSTSYNDSLALDGHLLKAGSHAVVHLLSQGENRCGVGAPLVDDEGGSLGLTLGISIMDFL
jgi:hypothetical protein